MRSLISLLHRAVPTINLLGTLAIAYVVVDLNDRLADKSAGLTRAEYARRIDKGCLPRRADERAVARIDADDKLRCSIFGDVGYGRVGRVISIATLPTPDQPGDTP